MATNDRRLSLYLDDGGIFVHPPQRTVVNAGGKAITNVTNNIGDLSDSAMKYDADTNKTKITLAGEGGTTITNRSFVSNHSSIKKEKGKIT